jgi:hypothetical protein
MKTMIVEIMIEYIPEIIAEKNHSQSNNQKNHSLDGIGCVVHS